MDDFDADTLELAFKHPVGFTIPLTSCRQIQRAMSQVATKLVHKIIQICLEQGPLNFFEDKSKENDLVKLIWTVLQK